MLSFAALSATAIRAAVRASICAALARRHNTAAIMRAAIIFAAAPFRRFSPLTALFMLHALRQH